MPSVPDVDVPSANSARASRMPGPRSMATISTPPTLSRRSSRSTIDALAGRASPGWWPARSRRSRSPRCGLGRGPTRSRELDGAAPQRRRGLLSSSTRTQATSSAPQLARSAWARSSRPLDDPDDGALPGRRSAGRTRRRAAWRRTGPRPMPVPLVQPSVSARTRSAMPGPWSANAARTPRRRPARIDLDGGGPAAAVDQGVAGQLARRGDQLGLVDQRQLRGDREGAHGLPHPDDVGVRG